MQIKRYIDKYEENSFVVFRTQVAETVASILGASVVEDQPLMEAGLDSLGAVDLRNALGAHFSLELPATFTFDHPSVAAMAAYIAAAVAPEEEVSGSAIQPHWRGNALVQHDFGAPTSTHVQLVGLSCVYPGACWTRALFVIYPMQLLWSLTLSSSRVSIKLKARSIYIYHLSTIKDLPWNFLNGCVHQQALHSDGKAVCMAVRPRGGERPNRLLVKSCARSRPAGAHPSGTLVTGAPLRAGRCGGEDVCALRQLHP